MRRKACSVVAGAAFALLFSFAPDAFAQRGGGGGGAGGTTARGGQPGVTRQVDAGSRVRRDWDRPAARAGDTLQTRVREACVAEGAADFCNDTPRGSTLRRRLWNACHGDNPPPACRRIFGDDDASHLRRRIWNACHGEDANPTFCRRIFGQDPENPHLRRRIWNACENGDLPPAFCRRVFGA